MTRLLCAALTLLALVNPAAACMPYDDADLSGFYWVWKNEHEACEPDGVVCIAAVKGGYAITWTYSPEVSDAGEIKLVSHLGIGKRTGRALAVMCGKAIYAYEISEGAKGHVEITGEGERWQKIKPPTSVSAPLPMPQPAPRRDICPCVAKGLKCGCGLGADCACDLVVKPAPDGSMEVVVEPEAGTAKKVEPGPYDHLPSEKVCGLNYNAGVAWREGVLKQATALGYYGWIECGEGFWGRGWLGGGWAAKSIRDEVEDCDALISIWSAVWYLRWPHTPVEDLPHWEADLRSLIGDAAYCRGQLPPPVPYWRVSRN